jgi:ubiquinone biosynthesis protein COQ9
MDRSADPTPGLAHEAIKRGIVQAALRIAQAAGSWDALHMHVLARESGLTLQELRGYFSDKDAVAEGFFDLADAALLSAGDIPGWMSLPVSERLHRAIMTWLDTLAPHRALVVEMLRYKIHPEHIHLQARGIARISRTMQWLRDVARLPSIGWRRELEEAVITSMYLATFSSWMADTSEGSQRTRRFLRDLLTRAEKGALWLGFPG